MASSREGLGLAAAKNKPRKLIPDVAGKRKSTLLTSRTAIQQHFTVVIPTNTYQK